ncbi:MAG: ArsC family reductase [Rhodospirillales bacterium]|nr:ArsC family reductase [Rhodospirillales bacterium]
MTTTIYGIKNCDTMKKALSWLDENDIEYNVHDYKKSDADADILKKAITAHGWDNVINRCGTTWRKLPDEIKNAMNENKAIEIALENPSIIKRPLLVHKSHIELGFSPDAYQAIFKDTA